MSTSRLVNFAHLIGLFFLDSERTVMTAIIFQTPQNVTLSFIKLSFLHRF